MKTHERILLLYSVGFVGAAGLAFYRGRQGQDLINDVLVQGAVAGTALNVASWLAFDSATDEGLALPNPVGILNTSRELGRMSKAAVDFLSQVDDNLFADFKENGIKLAAVPANPSIVNQDAS